MEGVRKRTGGGGVNKREGCEEAVGEVGLHEDWPIIWDEFGEEVLRVSVAAYFIKARPAHEERE